MYFSFLLEAIIIIIIIILRKGFDRLLSFNNMIPNLLPISYKRMDQLRLEVNKYLSMSVCVCVSVIVFEGGAFLHLFEIKKYIKPTLIDAAQHSISHLSIQR